MASLWPLPAFSAHCWGQRYIIPFYHPQLNDTRVVRMQLSDEQIELTDYLTSGGRSIPADAKPNDLFTIKAEPEFIDLLLKLRNQAMVKTV